MGVSRCFSGYFTGTHGLTSPSPGCFHGETQKVCSHLTTPPCSLCVFLDLIRLFVWCWSVSFPQCIHPITRPSKEVAYITGASKGIGRSITLRLAKLGYACLSVGRTLLPEHAYTHLVFEFLLCRAFVSEYPGVFRYDVALVARTQPELEVTFRAVERSCARARKEESERECVYEGEYACVR